MSQQTTLYDVPGPRARRLTLIVSVIAVALMAVAAYFLVYRPLAEDNQFTLSKCGPLVDPQNEVFGLVWARIGDGFRATLLAAAAATVLALIIGTLIAVLRIQLKAAAARRYTGLGTGLGTAARIVTVGLNAISRFFVEVFRGTPVVITILFVWLGLPELGIDFENKMWFLVIGLVIYNSVVIAEILRSGMEGLPAGQREAAQAIGLSPWQTTTLILLPQSFRIMLPALISQLVVVLKDTSLGFIIGYEEVLRVSQQVFQAVDDPNPIQMYAVIGTIFILVNYALSKLAGYVQRRLARGSKTRGLGGAQPPPAALGGAVQTATSGP